MIRSRLFAMVLLIAACKSGSKAADNNDDFDRHESRADLRASGSGMASTSTPIASEGPAKAPRAAPSAEFAKQAEDKPAAKHGDAGGGGQLKETEPTRSWFPETFLFEPLVVTDEQGVATVPVRVPDRLTTWHVLALAHSRSGAQGGTVTSFLGTLPTYVDPIVPKTLVIGDQVRVPIQLVNTTTSPVTAALALDAHNAKLVAASGARTIPAEGSILEYATLTADHAGTAQLRAALGGSDAVQHAIDVLPSGRPVITSRSGTLAAPRSLTIEGPAGSDPGTDRVRLLVFPGALALLRAELAVSSARDGVADDAYALLLAGKATALLAALGDKADPQAVGELTLVTSQRVIHDGRTLDVTTATLLAEAALAHGQNPVLSRLGERAAAYLAQNQRPDGTFSGGTGWTLQRVLVATADATRAVVAASTTPSDRQRALAVLARAAGAFERNLDHVVDGYTAATILASGAATGATGDKLRALVRASIKDADDGAKLLAVGDGVVRADGTVPTAIEATAIAVLALASDPKAPLADLGATLLGAYGPEHGWGDGRANLACMRAVLELFKTPVPSHVKITLTMDGKPITDGVLEGDKLRDVLALDVPAAGIAGAHTWQITADPAVPGLGYAFALHSWVPWDKETTHGGLELALPAKVTARVGRPTELALSAVAPSGFALHIVQSLPAGVQADTPSLDALVSAGTIERFTFGDGKVELFVPALQPGTTFATTLKVIPTLAGKLHAAASSIAAGTHEFHVPPSEWTIQ